MEVMHQCCAGLDVHQAEIVACVRQATGAKRTYTLERFPTTTQGLVALMAWLQARGVTHAVLEATGVYWKPVWQVLEGTVDLLLAHPATVKAIPGRKSDQNDAMWLADLLAHGLIRGSYVPPVAIQELRDLTRTRQQLVRERSQHVLRLQKTLDDANIKIAGIVTHLLGASGRGILQALIAGETAPERLLLSTTGRLRKVSPEELLTRLEGRVTTHHRFLLRLHLTQVDALDATLATLDQELEQRLTPFRATLTRLTAIPGVETVLARTLLAEIGPDVTAFPTAAHLRAWACVAPRLDQSAGHRRSTRQRLGSRWLKPMLIQAAWAAVRCPRSYFRAQYYRLRARRGPKKAIGAVAASLLTTIYHLLQSPDRAFHDLGPDYFTQLDPTRAVRRLTSRLEALGYTVQITPAA